MAELLQVAQLGDPVLRQTAEPIYNVHDAWVQALVDDLLNTLNQSNGVGISAPQVSNLHRLLVIASHPNPRYPNAPDMDPIAMINPHLIGHSDDMVQDWEGCLSVPGIRGLVPRYKEIEVEYTSRDGRIQRQVFSDFVARIFQHEFDHLNGIVFIDHVASTRDLMTDQEYLKRIVQAKIQAT